MEFFESDVRDLEASLRATPPPAAPIAFYGSSSIRFWTSLAADFPGRPVVNLGFGGSTLEACAWFFGRIVPPVAPTSMVVYAGDNDLGDGRSPAQVLEAFRSLSGQVRDRLGPIPLAYLSIKPSPARWYIVDRIRAANDLIRAELEGAEAARFVDLFPRMLTPEGGPRRELFVEDGLHLSDAGYRLWRAVVQEHADFIFSRNL